MWEVNFLEAVRTIESTMPMVIQRFLSCLIIALAYMLSVLGGAGIGFAIGAYGSNPAPIASAGAFVGFALCVWVLFKFRYSFFYSVRASHLLVLAEHRGGRPLPSGRALVDYARQQVAERFPSVAGLAQLDHELAACLRVMPALSCDVAGCLPIKQPHVVKAVQMALGQVAASLSEVLLAVILRHKEPSPWRAGLAAIESCAAQWPRLYKNAAWTYAFMYAGWLASFLVIQMPVFSIASSLPMSAGIWPLVFAVALSWVLKAAFFEPIAAAALMEFYFKNLEGKTADMDCRAKLGELEAYRDLQARANG